MKMNNVPNSPLIEVIRTNIVDRTIVITNACREENYRGRIYCLRVSGVRWAALDSKCPGGPKANHKIYFAHECETMY